MSVRRRVISALGVFGVGFAAALPFLKQTPPEASALPTAPQVATTAQLPSVALRIPVEESPTVAQAMPRPTRPSPSSNSASDEVPGITSETLLKAEGRLPTISAEFPSDPIVPPIDEITSKESASARGSVPLSDERPKNGPRIYRIRDGDTLRKIAQRYLNDSDRWREIFELNQKLIVDPELLPIGTEIFIPERLPTNRCFESPTSRESESSSAADPPLTVLVPIP